MVDDLSEALIEGTAEQRDERVLAALARTDFLLRYGDEPADLGAPLFAALDAALPKMTASRRIALVEKIAAVGVYYPEETLQLLRRLRQEPAADETVEGYWGVHTYSHSNVLLKLAHAHHRVAHGLLTDDQAILVTEELYALVLEEHALASKLKRGLPNDGKGAEGVIRSLLANGPSYSREFGETVTQVVLRELDTESVKGLLPQKLKAIDSIVTPLCDVQRHQTWSEGTTFQMRAQLLYTTHPNMVGREKVLARIRGILENEFEALPNEARAALWGMLSEAHRQTNYAKGHLVDERDRTLNELQNRLRESLEWVKKLFAQRTASPGEFRAAREIWK